jgi:CheY-like chemotaxis protein
MAAHILIIEDNEANLDLVRYLLEHRGYTTVEAIDGESGIDRASTDRPDLVLCDLQLPGIDGFGVLRAIRKRSELEGLAVIAVTALSMPSDRDAVLAAGFNGYLAKPIDPETFVAEVEAFLAPELRVRSRAASN